MRTATAHGATCRRNWATGTAHIRALLALARKSVWERVAQALCGDADLEHRFIDSTIVRAHQHSAGAQKKQVASTSAAREEA